MLTLPVSLWALQPIAPVFFKQRGVLGGGNVLDESWASCSLQENDMVGGGSLPPWSWGLPGAIFTYFLNKTCFYLLSITQKPSPAPVNIKGSGTSHSDYLGLLDLYHTVSPEATTGQAVIPWLLLKLWAQAQRSAESLHCQVHAKPVVLCD